MSDDEKEKPRKRSQADTLVDAALKHYRFFTSTENKPYAVFTGADGDIGPGGIAQPIALKGSGRMMNELAREVWKKTGKAVTATAIGTAKQVLLGYADEGEREPVHLRTGWYSPGRRQKPRIVIDIGDDEGRVVEVSSKRWRVLDESPIVFRRTTATSAFPIPKPGGDVGKLRSLVNISDAQFDLFVARIVAKFIPEIPVAILHLRGEPGSGKSDLARIDIRLSDPQPDKAELRGLPTNPQDWNVSATSSHALAIDNVTKLQPWQSDAFCGAVTGIADGRRKLYADDELVLIAARCALTITGLYTIGIRNDLEDRMVTWDLEPIPERRRKQEAALLKRFDRLHPQLFGALLDVLVEAMGHIESGKADVENAPRMADFARWVNAVDLVRETEALKTYLGNIEEADASIVDNDPIVDALRRVCDRHGGALKAAAAQWVAEIEMFGEAGDRSWPRSPEAFSQRLNLIAKQLRKSGWTVDRRKSGSHRSIAISVPDSGGEGR